MILYEELAPYFLACLDYLIDHHPFEIHVFCKKINPHAPFMFKNEKVHIYPREEYSAAQLLSSIEKINPDAIFCGGWIYKPYLKICRAFQKKTPTVLVFDNAWNGSLKQRLAVCLAPFFIRKHFNSAYVSGEKQKTYALKLGIPSNKIKTGFYCCNKTYFDAVYADSINSKRLRFPKKIIYIGRYVHAKGIERLWKSFIELTNDGCNDWELWCVGEGDIPPIEHPKIKHFGFVQPENISSLLSQTGVFILPSYFEPWGVVVHELASAGFPIICSSEVNASEIFVENEKNGYIFKTNQELKERLKEIMLLPEKTLVEMGIKSHELSNNITFKTWAKDFIELTIRR